MSKVVGAAAAHNIIIEYWGFWNHLSPLQIHFGTSWIDQSIGILRKVAGAAAAHDIIVEYCGFLNHLSTLQIHFGTT